MIPFFFGPADRRLFGLFEPAQGTTHATTAALLCNPFGQEAIRAHRIYRVLADRLVRAGVNVMRFDYYATGDSAGEDAEGEPAGWTRDVTAAHEELARRSRSARIIWVGARLGATLAVRATASLTRSLDRLILWEPVVDGSEYLRALAHRHMQQLDASFSESELPWRAMVASGSMALEREALGFELGDDLRARLSEVSPASFTTPRCLRCDVIERGERCGIAGMVEQWRRAGLAINEVVLRHDFDWMASEALDTAIVPAEPVQLLSRLITDPK